MDKKIKISTNWNECFKINLSRIYDPSTDLHEIIKLLIVKKLLFKYKKIKSKIRIYTEFNLIDGRICDVYFENWDTKESYAFEIQSLITKKWKDKTLKDYKNFSVSFMNTFDLIIIPLKESPNNILEINKWLDKYF